MRGWRRICCAVDRSEPSLAAFEVALGLAEALGATLALVHVESAVSPLGASAPFAPPAAPITGDDGGGAWLRALRERADARVSSGAVVAQRRGSPADEITAYAEETGCDVVVVGTHGRGRVARVLLGSVTDAVVQKARCPVLVVHPPEQAAGAASEQR